LTVLVAASFSACSILRLVLFFLKKSFFGRNVLFFRVRIRLLLIEFSAFILGLRRTSFLLHFSGTVFLSRRWNYAFIFCVDTMYVLLFSHPSSFFFLLSLVPTMS